MENRNKIVLRIWLLLYIILAVISVVHTFNTDWLSKLSNIGTGTLTITSMILFMYVRNRGEETVGTLGMYSVIAYTIIVIALRLDAFSLAILSTASFKDKALTILYNMSSELVTVLNLIALCSLIKPVNQSINKYKTISIIAILCVLLLRFAGYFIDFFVSSTFLKIKTILDYISNAAKYAFIILYLTDDEYRMIGLTNSYSNVELPPRRVIEEPTVQPAVTQSVAPTQPAVQPQPVVQTPVQPQVVTQPVTPVVPQVPPQQVVQQQVQNNNQIQ